MLRRLPLKAFAAVKVLSPRRASGRWIQEAREAQVDKDRLELITRIDTMIERIRQSA